MISLWNSSRKLQYLFLEIVCFSLLYYFLKDEEFGGINVVQEMIREEIVKTHVDEAVEPFSNLYQSTKIQTQLDPKSQQALQQTTSQVKQDTQREIKGAVRPSWWQDYFNRLYFSIVTGSTLGYGDIYPISNRCKCLVAIQLLTTLLIVSL